jgi:ligand-binding sensor domain-containing protein
VVNGVTWAATVVVGCLAGSIQPVTAGLNPDKPVGQYVRTVWEASTGLPQNTVRTILQTRDGYVWLGTEEGLVRFDGDRFEGKFRDGVHQVEVSDLMRRMVKETLLKFDATPLFPERIATTVPYKLSDAEAQLYKAVTDYVREEFNRAEALQNDKRAGRAFGAFEGHCSLASGDVRDCDTSTFPGG